MVLKTNSVELSPLAAVLSSVNYLVKANSLLTVGLFKQSELKDEESRFNVLTAKTQLSRR